MYKTSMNSFTSSIYVQFSTTDESDLRVTLISDGAVTVNERVPERRLFNI